MSELPGIPERVGRYEILLPIAAGGMATVYLARSRGIGGFEREVALKLTHAHLKKKATFADDLIEEAKLASRVRHPNVVPVLDVGDDVCGIYLVMDYVEGDSLAGLGRAAHDVMGGIPLPIALRVVVDALAGLHAAHELRDASGRLQGLVHRDFSPQNILVDTTGRAMLADFGVAKAATRPGQTIAGFVKGKIAYMSPEQARGLSLDRTSDVWAAGVIAWELVTGHRLSAPGNDADRILKVVSEVPPRARAYAPDISPELDEAIARALTMDARRRTQTAAIFAKELTLAAASLGGLADVDAVADFVQEIASSKLQDRRARAEEVVALRARMSDLVREPARSAAGEGAQVEPGRSPDAATTERDVPRARADVVEEPPHAPTTDTVSTSASHAEPGRPRFAVAAAATVVVALLAIAFGWRVLARQASRQASSSLSSASPPPPPSPSASPSLPPPPLPPAAATTATATVTPTPAVAPPEVPPAQSSVPRASPRRASPAKPPRRPSLAPSPYEPR